MASRNLGTLTLDLVAKTGGFVSGLSQAEREADKRAKAISAKAKDIEKSWSGLGKAIAAGFAGLTIGSVFSKFIQESRDAQNEQAQLAAVLRSTGQSAGYSADQLNAMADALEGTTTFSAGEINNAQTRLLAYTNIVGEQFPQALQAAIDMSARLGISLDQSAETIGKALDVPSQGLTALTKQGFRFTEDQKKVIERLEQTGKVAEAQGIILKTLEGSYGGAAEAARNTFGGAIIGLQNQLNSLMTGDDGSLSGATDSVNELAKTLASPEVKAAFAGLATLITNTIGLLVDATTHFINFGRFAGEALAKFAVGSADPIERANERIEELNQTITRLDTAIGRRRGSGAGEGDARLSALEAQAQAARKELENLQKTRQALIFDANNPAAKPNPPTRGNSGGGNVNKDKPGKDPYAEAQRYLESLQRQAIKVQELSVYETALAEIQSGRLGKITKAQNDQILAVAKEIDAIKARDKERDESAKRLEENNTEVQRLYKEAQSAIQSVETPLETYNRKLRENTKLAKDNPFISGDVIARLNNKAWEEFSDTFEKINTQAQETNDWAKELGLTFNSAFEDAISSGKSFRDIISGIEQDIIRLVTRQLVTKPFANYLEGALGSLFGGGNGPVGPQTEQQMGDAVFSQLGKYATGGSSGGFLSNIFGGLGKFFGFFADGGMIPAGGWGIAGEAGPEIISGPATVTPMSKVGGMTVNITQTFAPGTDRRTTNQAALDAQMALTRAQRNA